VGDYAGERWANGPRPRSVWPRVRVPDSVTEVNNVPRKYLPDAERQAPIADRAWDDPRRLHSALG